MVTPNRSHRRSRRKPRSRGQALVEFALVLPIFFLVLSGIMDFGFMLYSRMTVINSAREGARAAISQPPATWATIPSLATAAVTSAASGSGISGLSITPVCVRGLAIGGCTFTNNVPPTGSDAKPGDSIRVTVEYDYHSFFPLLFGSTIRLGSEVQMVLEGT